MRAPRWLGPVAERDFGLLWSASTLSLMGDYAFRLAFITFIITETDSANTLAVAGAALLAPPLVFYLLGGVVGDRVQSRRMVMIAADVFRFLATVAAAYVVAVGSSVPAVILLGVVIGIGSGFYLPASFAFMTEVVDKDQLTAANSANSISRQVGIIVGPVLAGVLVATAGVAWAFAFDALTFLGSAALIAAIRPRPARTVEPAPKSRGFRQVIADARAGISHVSKTRWLLVSCLVGAVANAIFAGNLDVTVPLIISDEGVDEAARLGLYYTLQGAGALLGAVVLARLTITRMGSVSFAALSVMAAAITLVGVFGEAWPTYLMAVGYGLGLHFFNSIFPSVVQSRTPSELLSRVGSFVYLAFHGLMPLGTLLVGPLIVLLGTRATAIVTGAVALAMALAVMQVRSIRELTKEPPATAPEPAREPATDAAPAPSPPSAPAPAPTPDPAKEASS